MVQHMGQTMGLVAHVRQITEDVRLHHIVIDRVAVTHLILLGYHKTSEWGLDHVVLCACERSDITMAATALTGLVRPVVDQIETLNRGMAFPHDERIDTSVSAADAPTARVDVACTGVVAAVEAVQAERARGIIREPRELSIDVPIIEIGGVTSKACVMRQ